MISGLIIAVYLLMALMVAWGFLFHDYNGETAIQPDPVSIIIAAKNEEAYIETCLRGIAGQNFRKELLEIIVVDDHSSDATAAKAIALLQSLHIKHQLITNQTHLGKKESIKLAIGQASHDLIITRDADTFTNSNEWLSSVVNFHTKTKKEFIICPVALQNDGTLLGTFQEIETAVLSLFTISSVYWRVPFLCSGANLAFTKNLFYRTGAYQNHIHIPSGDDVFFLEEVKKTDRNTIAYLKNKNAVVFTYPEKSIREVLWQKTRWSAKVFKSASLVNWFIASVTAITNFWWLFVLFYALFRQQNLFISLFFILAKLLIDILLVFLASSFVKVKAKSAVVVFIGFLYPIYASVIVGLAILMKPKWKSN